MAWPSSSNLLNTLSAQELHALQDIARIIAFPAGQEIFREGDPGDGMYIVKRGQVQISVLVPPKASYIFSHIGPGELFGEMAVFDEQPRSASAFAEVDTELYFIPGNLALDMLRRCPDLFLTLVKEITRRFRDFNRLYVQRVLQAERMTLVGRSASTIVHDIKNPLAVIRMASELALNPRASPEMKESALNRVLGQVDRINNLVMDILEYTRGGQSCSQLVRQNFAQFLHGLVDEFQRELDLRSVQLCCANDPPQVDLHLCPPRLNRVFYNLFLNAVEAMPGGGRITLRFRATDQAVFTEIEDSGKGIAPEIMNRLFEEFATYGKRSGTGLGLAIALKIVREHGGSLSAHNQPGGGAVFTIELPKAPPPVHAAAKRLS